MRLAAFLTFLLILVVSSVEAKKKKEKKEKTTKSVPASESSVKSDVGEENPESWLGPWWEKRASFEKKFKDALINYRAIQIRGFLNKDKALALHRYLSQLIAHLSAAPPVCLALWALLFPLQRAI